MRNFFTLKTFLGSRSDPRIPRTYEAVISNAFVDEHLVEQYLGDTICSLVNLLKKNRVNPKTVKIYEIYNSNRELEIPASMYTTDEGKFTPRTELCKITVRYGEEEKHPLCSFQDRHGKPCGPYYDLA